MRLHLFCQFHYFGSSVIRSTVGWPSIFPQVSCSVMNPGSPGSQDDYLKCNSDSWSLGPLEPLQMHAFRLGARQSLPSPGFLVGRRSPRGQSPQQLVWLLLLLPVCDSMTLSEPQSLSWSLPLALTLSPGLLLPLILESVAQPEALAQVPLAVVL